MAKKIRRQIEIGGAKRWISGDSEQEYADNLARALTGGAEPRLAERKHNFQAYAQKWFHVKGMLFPGSLFLVIISMLTGLLVMWVK